MTELLSWIVLGLIAAAFTKFITPEDYAHRYSEQSIANSTMEAYCQYSGEQRVRKYVDKGSVKEERIYLDEYEKSIVNLTMQVL
jgi:hypothetical protein